MGCVRVCLSWFRFFLFCSARVLEKPRPSRGAQNMLPRARKKCIAGEFTLAGFVLWQTTAAAAAMFVCACGVLGGWWLWWWWPPNANDYKILQGARVREPAVLGSVRHGTAKELISWQSVRRGACVRFQRVY